MLSELLAQIRGATSAVLANTDGKVEDVAGSMPDAGDAAALAATLTEELSRVGAMLGLGELTVASLKAASTSRVWARQSGSVLAIELDPRRAVGELEARLQDTPWAEDLRTASLAPPEAASARPAPHVMPAGSVAGPAPRPTPSVPIPLPLPGARASTPLPSTPLPSAPLPRATPTIPLAAQRRADSPPPAAPAAARRSSPPAAAAPRGTPSRLAAVAHKASAPGAAAPRATAPVFAGDLEEFALPALLELLRNSQRTGLLVCTTSAGVGTILLSRGQVIAADSPHAVALRDQLLTSPRVSPELRRALANLPVEAFDDDQIDHLAAPQDEARAQVRDQVRTMMPAGELERARTARIFSAFRELLGWTVGRFSFDAAVPVAATPTLTLSVHGILMKLYQEQDR